MEQIEVILNTYYCKPYRPEFLLRKIQDELKYYNFTIIEESKKKSKNSIIILYLSLFLDLIKIILNLLIK